MTILLGQLVIYSSWIGTAVSLGSLAILLIDSTYS